MWLDVGVFAAALAVSFAIPGPDTMLLFSRALSGGIRAATPVGVGLIVGKVVLMTVAFVGVTAVVRVLGPALVAVKLIGGAYLVVVAIRMWRRSRSAPDVGALAQSSSLAGTRSGLRGLALGSVLTMANPQALIFYVAVMPSVLHARSVRFVEYLWLSATLAVVVAGIAAAYVAAATLFGRKLHGSRSGRAERMGAVLLALTGLAIAAR